MHNNKMAIMALCFLIVASISLSAQARASDLAGKVMTQGKEFFQQGRYQDALASFRELSLETSVFQAEASFWMIKSQLALNRLDEAQIALETYLGKYPKDSGVEEAMYLRGRVLYLMADLVSAVKAFSVFLESFATSSYASNAYYWMGESLLALGQLEEARKMFSIVVRNYPTSFKAEAASYKQSLIEQKGREEQLLGLLTWSHQENIKNIEDFNRRELAYQEAVRSYQKKLTSLAPQDFKDELRILQQKSETLQSEKQMLQDRLTLLNTQMRELQGTYQKNQDELQKANTQLTTLKSSQSNNEETLEQRRKLLDAKEEALKIKEQALMILDPERK